MDVNAFCTQSSVLVVAGKGGVGKSTVSAALATLAARNGLSVLLVELEERRGPRTAVGHHVLTRDGAELSTGGTADVLSTGGTADQPPRSAPIRAWTLTPDDTLVEYLVDHRFSRAARRLAKSGMLDVVATAIPGVRNILVLGKIVNLEQAAAADLIVVDGPAAGHATTFLTSAQGLLDSTRSGPIRTLATDVVGLLTDPARCQVVLVTLAEETPVNETVETAFNLEDRVGTHLGPVIVNDLYPRLDDLDADPQDAAAAAGVILRPGEADAMRAAAAFRRRREEMQAEQATRLADALPLPQLWLPHLFAGEIGLPEIDRLVDALETGLLYLREPAGRTGWTGQEPAPGNRVHGLAAAGTGSRS